MALRIKRQQPLVTPQRDKHRSAFNRGAAVCGDGEGRAREKVDQPARCGGPNLKSTMRAPVESRAVFVSLRCYERLLALYPERHRREYGFPMSQLFGDQCRDAWRESRSWGLITLWLRVLPDLVKTSVLEHLSAMKARKSMIEKISEITNVNPAPLRTFFTVFQHRGLHQIR